MLATARRGPDSPPSDQVLVLCRPPGSSSRQIERVGHPRVPGDLQPGFQLAGRGRRRHVLDDPFADISSRTMLPVSHVLWSSVWLGLAAAAVDRARRFVQAEGPQEARG